MRKLTKKEQEAVSECLRKLKDAASLDDTEVGHGDADDALCELVDILTGSKEITEAYRDVPKWYA